jgi:hypothetical protein
MLVAAQRRNWKAFLAKLAVPLAWPSVRVSMGQREVDFQ